MTNEDLPLLDLLDDAREQASTEVNTVEVAPRRWPVAIAAAAAALLIAGIVFAPSAKHDDSATTTTLNPAPRPSIAPTPSTTAAPPFVPGLYPDLPPEDATPSSPHPGELVASAALIHAGAWYLYADGRLIWIVDFPPSPGFVEQVLTPAGVERVRSELLSTGLFDEDPPTGNHAGPPRDTLGTVRARETGRLLYAHEPDSERYFISPVDYLRNMDQWLPHDLWLDRRVKEYVASTYAFCVSRISPESTHTALPDPSKVLTLLHAGYTTLIGSRQPTQLAGIVAGSCFKVTRDEAGALADEILRSGWAFDVTQPISMSVSLSIWALLPHGVPAIWGG